MDHAAGSTTPSPSGEHAVHYDPIMNRIGMWLFLFTEVLLFGMLFIAYAVYLTQYQFEFRMSSHELDKLLGATNTLILLTSSLTMALSIAAMERGKRGLCLGLMAVTVLLSLAFLAIKSVEWGHKFEHHIYPRSPEMLARPYGEQVFYGLYYTMTGLHALHVIIGAMVILAAMGLVATRRIHPERLAFIENTGLYWHLVDMVWIFLFPLFYLIG